VLGNRKPGATRRFVATADDERMFAQAHRVGRGPAFELIAIGGDHDRVIRVAVFPDEQRAHADGLRPARRDFPAREPDKTFITSGS
jgi:hypothetical protein